MYKQISCLYCGNGGELFPVKLWDQDITNYYCGKHYNEAVKHQREERNRFIEYYSSPERRKWLSVELLELWEKLRQ